MQLKKKELPSKIKKPISKLKFINIIDGQRLEMKFMGFGYAASEPFVRGDVDLEDNTIISDCILVRFEEGAWKGKTLECIRQQIYRVK